MSSRLGKFFLLVYVPPLALLALVALISFHWNIPINKWTRDPATIAHVHPLTGMVSNLGILIWCAAAAICLFTWRILQNHADGRKAARFFLASGLLSALLLFDDLFLFHEYMYKKYLGIPEKLTSAVYATLLAVYLVRFRARILSRNFAVLLAAVTFLGLSVALDIWSDNFPSLPQFSGDWHLLLEDGFKLLGISGWCGYLLRTSYQEVLSQSPSPSR